jgi:[acyl-carrier-protein] S-malonyltransferase
MKKPGESRLPLTTHHSPLTNMNAFLFPGQGSQKVGMGRALCESSPAARQLFERANEILGYDLQAICFDGPPETLTDTRHAQPALLTVGILHWQRAQSDGLSAQMTAGHSLGEYAALVAAGALSFESALRLVQKRAELMAAAPSGAMAALIGLADDKIPEVLGRVEGTVVAANFNSPGQIVISGAPDAVEAAMREAKSAGAKMTVRLQVSGAFHSPLMHDAGQEMAQLINAAPFHDAQIPVYQNTTARPATDADLLKAALRDQMTSPVRWTQTVQAMIADGATHFYELGPGNVLAGLVKRIDKSVTVETTDR